MTDPRTVSTVSQSLAARARMLIARSRKLKMEMKQLAEEMDRHKRVLAAHHLRRVSSN